MKKKSNIKIIINNIKKNNLNVEKINDVYEPISGYLYCVHNEMYKYYGDNVYKCRNSIEPVSRMKNFTTSYIKPISKK